MWISSFRSGLLAALSAAFISGYHSDSYIELEVTGNTCPARNKCQGYRNNLTYMDRNCECDHKCTIYKDCCIDALPNLNSRQRNRRKTPARTDVTCLNYGEHEHTGVYVINKCSRSWNGPRQIRERCDGPDDFSDPLIAAPATDVTQNRTYRNLACAECNNANLASLTNFQVKLSCEGLLDLTENEIMADITYNEQYQLWGVYRLNRVFNETEFVDCDVLFDVPEYLNNSVRFCRSNLISRCTAGWRLTKITKQCAQYMAVVYSNGLAYRNPHCAICNHLTLEDLSCSDGISVRRSPMSFAHLLDVNQRHGDKVGMRREPTTDCPPGHKYDPFFKKCRQLVCALPGYNLVNGRCVRG